MTMPEFDAAFEALTGNSPFPWQCALYERFLEPRTDNIPASCNLPTGLGKTSVIAIWLLALAAKPEVMPRRLVYVVNRRTVVDQTTDEVMKYRRQLGGDGPPWTPCLRELSKRLAELSSDRGEPLAISTLRGQFADNRQWSADPSKPAVICGTVDMIGSRLLFSGYGCGFKTRPLHAGFLGQDALLVHDEAHLEPAFQKLLLDIEKEQREGRTPDFRPMRVMELTATSRGTGEVFELTDADRANEVVNQRINAKKAIHLHENKDEKKLAEEIADLALKFKDSKRAVLVFVRKVDDIEKVTKKLPKGLFEQLTGTLRGLERDGLVKKPIFQRFLPESNRDEKVTPTTDTVYLVCTSAGEVGVNISADHLVCDLSTFDSMAQRFGRVNRFGEPLDHVANIDIVHPVWGKDDKLDDIDRRRQRTLDVLRNLHGDGSPRALREVHHKALKEGSVTEPMSTDRTQALRDYILATYAPPPTILDTSDILFDSWALTSIRGKLPGRPPVEAYLHGISDYDPPQTTVAWRTEVELLTPDILERNKLNAEAALDLFPLKPHEELSGPTHGKNKVFEQLEEIASRDAKREPDKRLSAWVIDGDGTTTIYSLAKLVEKDKQNKPVIALGGRTVLLPPQAGGFLDGLLKGDEPHSQEIKYDVSDQFFQDAEKTIRRRIRLWDNDPRLLNERKAMRLVRRIDIPSASGDEDAESRSWLWFERPRGGDDEGSKTAATNDPITWDHHTKDVTNNAEEIVKALELLPELQQAIVVAAKMHDFGKQREVWQRSIGNPNPKGPPWYAKSGRTWTPRELTGYRHEFGSLIDAKAHADFGTLSPEMRELVLHIIATHHGRGRPHFSVEEAFDPQRPLAAQVEVARETPQRFARLQRKYGRWGLAYLESLLRAADYAASANPTAFEKEEA